MKRLTRQELEKKVKFHEKKAAYYERKIEVVEKEKHKIGFRY